MTKKIQFHKVAGSLPAQLEADSVYLVRVGAGFDVYVTNGTGVVSEYRLNADKAVLEHLSAAGDAHSLVSTKQAGFMSPSHLAELSSQVSYYNQDGPISRSGLKVFFGEATSDQAGEFTIDWSAAGFATAPHHVAVEAYGAELRKPWATINKATSNNLVGRGYTTVSAGVQMKLGGPVESSQPAASVPVTVMAWGF